MPKTTINTIVKEKRTQNANALIILVISVHSSLILSILLALASFFTARKRLLKTSLDFFSTDCSLDLMSVSMELIRAASAEWMSLLSAELHVSSMSSFKAAVADANLAISTKALAVSPVGACGTRLPLVLSLVSSASRGSLRPLWTCF